MGTLLELAKEFDARCKSIDPAYRAELKGGISICVDIQRSIKAGHIKTLDDVLMALSKKEESLQTEFDDMQRRSIERGLVMTPQEKAKLWLDDNSKIIILDTETTGLDDQAEVVEISLIDANGVVLLDTLVKPIKPIPAEVTAIHGITDAMVADAPTWAEIHERFCQIIKGRTLVIYNAQYDVKMINQTAKLYGLGSDDFRQQLARSAECAMLAYAEYHGLWDSVRGGYKWQRLSNAAAQMGVVIEGKAHRAVADCLTTLGVIKAMASVA